MQRYFFTFLFLLLFVFNISAQTKEARKIDEFNSYNCEDMMARLDYFANSIMAEPNVTGFIIVYEGEYSKYIYNNKGGKKLENFLPRFGEAVLRTHEMQRYLLGFRRFPKEKVLFIGGGFRKNHTIEFWLTPQNASPPKISPTLENVKYRKGTPQILCSPIMLSL